MLYIKWWIVDSLHNPDVQVVSHGSERVESDSLRLYSFSSGSSWFLNWTGVSCIAGRFFTNWAIREAPFKLKPHLNWLLICTINFLYYLCFLDFLTASPPLLTWFVVMISSSFPNFQSCYVFDQISLSSGTSLLELFSCSSLITIRPVILGLPFLALDSPFADFVFFPLGLVILCFTGKPPQEAS